ncbi:hypothetical protein ElyMa_000922300 [Elysia marginata]|uniref:Uncharacterized protein n=1 Tax=Elysia marginata TaxID=1093978 RepID=A0AAV4H9E7_9GAST|nr:hypothetical protein ElyMa_000922300 [Elysia marginata]
MIVLRRLREVRLHLCWQAITPQLAQVHRSVLCDVGQCGNGENILLSDESSFLFENAGMVNFLCTDVKDWRQKEGLCKEVCIVIQEEEVLWFMVPSL